MRVFAIENYDKILIFTLLSRNGTSPMNFCTTGDAFWRKRCLERGRRYPAARDSPGGRNPCRVCVEAYSICRTIVPICTLRSRQSRYWVLLKKAEHHRNRTTRELPDADPCEQVLDRNHRRKNWKKTDILVTES